MAEKKSRGSKANQRAMGKRKGCVMGFTRDQYLAARIRLGMDKEEEKPAIGKPATREDKLQEEIVAWCDKQWPRWKVIRARMDKKSTIGNGIHDITVFGPYPLCVLVECKAKNGKRSKEQQIWAAEMRMLGWTVELVRSMDEFHAAVKCRIDPKQYSPVWDNAASDPQNQAKISQK